MSKSIPVLDLSRCGLHVEQVDEETLSDVGKELYQVLTTSGFAYLSNHGIPEYEINGVNESAAKFYALPDDEKRKYYVHELKFAYDPIGSLKADSKHTDYQEGFRITGAAYEDKNLPWPNVPSFRKRCFDLSNSCKTLLWRLLKALGVAMKLKDPEYFCKAHSLLNRKGNGAQLKLNHYPPVLNDEILPESQPRLGEHTDWGTMILLFQDNVGGLQVKNENGDFFDVTPIPGTIVMNIGDTLHKWSGGRLRATVHRVVKTKDPEKRKLIRKSTVYAGQADDDVLMEPLQYEDGEENEEEGNEKPLTVGQYMAQKFEQTFQ